MGCSNRAVRQLLRGKIISAPFFSSLFLTFLFLAAYARTYKTTASRALLPS